jgi:hypothetical protein
MSKNKTLLKSGFWFYCPIQTFQEDNLNRFFKDEYGEIVSYADTLPSQDNPIELNDYFEKGFQCFRALTKQLSSTHDDLTFNRDSLDFVYEGIKQECLTLFDHLIEHKRISVFKSTETGDAIDFEDVRQRIIVADTVDEAYDTFESVPEIFDLIPSRGAIYAFAALQHLDGVVLSEVWRGSDMPSQEYALNGFRDSYFLAVTHAEMEVRIYQKLAKERVAPATQSKSHKTNQRKAFIWKLFRKNSMSRKEFSQSTEIHSQVNEFSISIRLAALTPTGGVDTIYRALSPKKKTN